MKIQKRLFNNLSLVKVDLDRNNEARRIICRFRSAEDLRIFSNKLGIPLSKDVKEVNLYTKDIKYKKTRTPYQSKGVNRDWEEEWNELPEFTTDFIVDEYCRIIFIVPLENFNLSECFEQPISDKTDSIWYPKLEKSKQWNLRVLEGEEPKYPVYVVSKNRYEPKSWHTSVNFTEASIFHYLVVEPDQYEIYKKNFENKYCKVIELDMEYKTRYDCFSDTGNLDSTGPGPARNFCWDHSIKLGAKWHWVFDDNVRGLFRFWRGRRIPCKTGTALRTCEEFVDRYDNIAIAGLNYLMFCIDKRPQPAYILNTRIYSMLLIRNDIPYRWRGRYNEDTDLSLRALKDNWCTIQFNIFVGQKLPTQTVQGGNTAEFYSNEGTVPKSTMLVEMHPDVTKLVYKFGRWHHYVDYSVFKQKLHRREGYDYEPRAIDERGMKVVEIESDICNTSKDTADELRELYKDAEDLNKSDMYLKGGN